MRNITNPRSTSTDVTRNGPGAAPIFTSGSRCLRAWVMLCLQGRAKTNSSTARRREARAEGEPAFGRIVDELQIAAVEFLEPAPPLDRLELFVLGCELVAAEAD